MKPTFLLHQIVMMSKTSKRRVSTERQTLQRGAVVRARSTYRGPHLMLWQAPCHVSYP